MNRRYFRSLLSAMTLLLLMVGCAPAVTPTLSALTSTAPPAPPTATSIPTPAPTVAPTQAAPRGVYIGLFNGTSITAQDLAQTIGKQAAILAFYQPWTMNFSSWQAQALATRGEIALITWEYQTSGLPGMEAYADRPLDAITEGKFDQALRTWAQTARTFGKPLLLRWGHEMNGNWYPWGGTNNGGGTTTGFGDPQLADGPERFVAAYRHIHDVFQQEGATNVLWVWCPNAPFSTMDHAYGSGDWNQVRNYYPGDAYVDWMCFDGYNWGTSSAGQAFKSTWSSFDQIFGQSYQTLLTINATKPILIGEFASTEIGGDKAAWITDAFARMRSGYPNIHAFIWFHIDKETDWRIDSSPASLKAFQAALRDDYWLEKWPGLVSK